MKHPSDFDQLPPLKALFIEIPDASAGDKLTPIIRSLNNSIEVRHLTSNNMDGIQDGIRWADLIWLERINSLTVHLSRLISELKNKKVICRLHGTEIFSNLPEQMSWDAIDTIIFPTTSIQERFNHRFQTGSKFQVVSRGAIAMNIFTIPAYKENTKNMVLLGTLTFRKGLPLCLLFFREVLKKDKEYRLFIRGDIVDPRLKLAAVNMIKELNLGKRVCFSERVDDLNRYFDDKSHILSFSLFEPFHNAIGEGMAAGLKPVIYAWQDSRKIWPEEYIFNDFRSFMDIVEDVEYSPHHYRQLLYDSHLDLKGRLPEIKDIIRRTCLMHKK